MRFSLKDYQDTAVRGVLRCLDEAKDDYRSKERRIAFALSAITGAGKTVMASAVIEALFDGSEEFEIDPDPTATVLWVTDDPNLNEQTRYRIMQASDRLGADRLKVIADGFVADRLAPGTVYFLNRQKLTAKTFINRSDKRTVTLWETIGNTIEDPDITLIMVLDEAHRGMGPQTKPAKVADEQDRSSTVLRLINGYNGTPPVPIVWGISATIERFTAAMKDATRRVTLPSVIVDTAQVQASGLLKDTIVLDLPDENGAFETVLAREAAKATREASRLWDEYSLREKEMERVFPLLVLQVPNKPSVAEITALLDAIYEAWPELGSDAIANVYGEHTEERFGKHRARYISPQDVHDASEVRILLAKDAISTGWDCPRAETLLSLRPAKDRTYITQLLGRLVRTPLARRIDSDERLNAVSCFLPKFDVSTAKEVAEVMTGAKVEGDGGASPSGKRVLIDPATMLWNEELPGEVRTAFSDLPSKAAPRTPARPIKRLLKLAAELAVDELHDDPSAVAHTRIYAVLDGQYVQNKKSIDRGVEDILKAQIRRITADRRTGSATESNVALAADARTVDDAFRVAVRGLGAAVANGYVRKLAVDAATSGGELDLRSAKARVAAATLLPGLVEDVEIAADKLTTEWLAEFRTDMKSLPEGRRVAYDEIKQQARDPQPVDIVVPVSRIEMTAAVEGEEEVELPTRRLHLLADEDGWYPVGRLRTWEMQILDTELAREDLVAWYRNPSSAAKDAVQIPWKEGTRWRSVQPDFIFFTRTAENGIGACIVDPHGHYLADALGKLLGLAEFAEEYCEQFLRIEAISSNTRGDLGPEKGSLRLLDLLDPHVRDAVRQSETAVEAYSRASVKYVVL